MQSDPQTGHVDLSFALPGRRCDKHSFMRTADGTCIRCAREARQARERGRAVWTALVCAGTIAALGMLLARRATADAQAAAALPPPKARALAPYDIADDGARRRAKLEENDRIAGEFEEANPPPVPFVVSTSLSGITPEERDRAFAAREAQRQRILARNAAAARRVTDERLAEENEALNAFRRREALEAQGSRVAVAATPTRAPVGPLRVTGRRHCGCSARDPRYEFSF